MIETLLNKLVTVQYLTSSNKVINRKGRLLSFSNNTIRILDNQYRTYWIDKNSIISII